MTTHNLQLLLQGLISVFQGMAHTSQIVQVQLADRGTFSARFKDESCATLGVGRGVSLSASRA